MKKGLFIQINENYWEKAKIQATKNRTTLSQFVESCLEDFFEKERL